MCYKENKSLFLDVIKHGRIFPSKASHFQYDHRFFLIEKWGTLKCAKRYSSKKVLNLDCQDFLI